VGGNSHVGREKFTICLIRIGSDFGKYELELLEGGGVSAGVGGRPDTVLVSILAGHGFE
jgi:hypothetical protein